MIVSPQSQTAFLLRQATIWLFWPTTKSSFRAIEIVMRFNEGRISHEWGADTFPLMHNYKSDKMNKSITMSLGALVLLLTGLFVSACSSDTAQENVHFSGSAPVSGFHLEHAADGDRDNLGHGYVSGSGEGEPERMRFASRADSIGRTYQDDSERSSRRKANEAETGWSQPAYQLQTRPSAKVLAARISMSHLVPLLEFNHLRESIIAPHRVAS